MPKEPKMPSSCCGVESTIHGAHEWQCSQCGRIWTTVPTKPWPGGTLPGSNIPRFNPANVEFVERSNGGGK